jgi:hypothetical protein
MAAIELPPALTLVLVFMVDVLFCNVELDGRNRAAAGFNAGFGLHDQFPLS